MLRLDLNESNLIDEKWYREILGLLQRDSISRYCSPKDLEDYFAELHGVSSPNVVATSGGDDALQRIVRTFVKEGDHVLVTSPTFPRIDTYVRAAGGIVRNETWLDSDFPVGNIAEKLDASTKVAFVVSPNNPTGLCVSERDFVALASARPTVLFVLDAVYGDFTNNDLTDIALSLPNCIVVRSLSKSHGLSGLRVGYIVGHQNHIEFIKGNSCLFSVASPSIQFALQWLKKAQGRVKEYLTTVSAERQELKDLLDSLGAHPIPSEGNFVLCKFENAHEIHSSLYNDGILVKQFDSGVLSNYLRITCPGNKSDFGKLKDALFSAFKNCLVEPVYLRKTAGLDELR